MIHFDEPVRRGRMALWKPRDTDAEAAGVGVTFEIPDEPHEVRRLGEDVARVVVIRLVARGIAPERKDVAHPGRRIALKD